MQENGIRRIPLSRGMFSIVDAEDYERLSKYRWCVEPHGKRKYAVRKKPNNVSCRMHRVIMNATPGQVVDHINHDCLDNRKSNLRVCSVLDNGKNRIKYKNNRSGFKGVSWHKKANGWGVYIYLRGKNKWLGAYEDIKEAAKAYNHAAIKYYGDFACLNKI